MDQFRNKQPGGRRASRPNNSIDGFSQPRRGARPAGSAPGLRRTGPSQSARPGQINDFNRPDGFNPQNRNRILQPASGAKPSIDKPVLIDTPLNKPKQKRRWFGLRKKAQPANGRKKKMSRKRKILRGLAIFLAIVLLVGGFLTYKGYINLNKVLKGGGGAAALEANVDPSKLRGEGDGRVNILLLGRGGEGHDGADLTDTMILVSIDPIAKEASLLSIPRDLYVPVPGHGSMKINAAFSAGKMAVLNKSSKQTSDVKKQAEAAGFDLVEKTVETNLGVPVHYHAIVDFSGFMKAIDTVGGIDLNVGTAVKEQMRIDGKNYMLDVKPGQQHMDGFKALAYSRSRHTSLRGDFDRSERQREIILALKQKVLSVGTFSNPAKISGLLDTLGGHVQTNFSLQDLQRLYDLGKQIDSSKITSLGLADPPNNYVITDNIGGASVVVPRAGVGNFKEIQSYLRNVLKDSYIRNENASIAVLNGTSTPGLATKKADDLKAYGYNITAVDNAPTRTYTKTTIVDLRSGAKKYTKNYLEKRFGVPSVTSLPDPAILPGTADFVIIIGTDQAN
jgi:LCP family protein required for cell wall assembly